MTSSLDVIDVTCTSDCMQNHLEHVSQDYRNLKIAETSEVSFRNTPMTSLPVVCSSLKFQKLFEIKKTRKSGLLRRKKLSRLGVI